MAAWVWVVIAIAVVVVVALVVVGARKRRTAMLRGHFGPEYDRAVEKSEDQRAAEADLRARERQRAEFDLQPLPEATRLGFASEWRDLQERFIDQPAQATGAADTLITRVMEARGYPMKDFDAQAELISVDHPDTVENYRFARLYSSVPRLQQASTEDLREALLRYRSLFDELLRPEGNGAAGVDGQCAASQLRQPAAVTTDRTYRTRRSRWPVRPGKWTAAAAEAGSAGPAAPDTEYDNQR